MARRIRRVEPADLMAARRVLGVEDPPYIDGNSGHAYDPHAKKMFKDGFAPWQLSRGRFIFADPITGREYELKDNKAIALPTRILTPDPTL